MPALSTPAEIEAVADQLTAAADALHARLLAALAAHAGQRVPDAEQAALRHLLADEQQLRARANGLYAAAAAHVVAGFPEHQAHVLALTARATEQIRQITQLSNGIGLIAALGGFAAALASGQLVALGTAFDVLRRQVRAIQAAP